MKYFVKIENGQPVTGVVTEENLLQLFPDMMVVGVPPEFVRVKRAEFPPPHHPCRSWVGTQIVMVDGVPVEQHLFEEATPEEAAQIKQNIQRSHKQFGFKSWVWNEQSYQYDPPSPYPTDGKKYEWKEETLSWVLSEPTQPSEPS